MSIVCGTDFSAGGAAAARVAAAWARKAEQGLVLLHAGGGDDAAQRLAGTLAAAGGAPSTASRVVPGPAHRALVEESHAPGASLVVVGAVGESGEHGWLGGTAERVARGAAVPVVAVRDAERLVRWLDGGAPLRVFAAVDGEASGLACVRWMSELAAMGPVEAILGHVVWPPEEHQRLGLEGPMDMVQLRPEVRAAVEGRLARAATAWTGDRPVRFELRVGWGRVPDHLAHLAAEVEADLVVVGLHRRTAWDRLWRGSVTHGLLAGSDTNVACVPL